MGLAAQKIEIYKDKYNYADYLSWDDNQRWEIIDGEVYDMSPAPIESHQAISGELSVQIGNFLSENQKKCKLYAAPFDVRFPEGVKDNEKIIDVVQPDIVVICDRSKIDRRGCIGAPDFIIEILSPYTAHKDHTIKRDLYEKNGVKEYWIIDPSNKIVLVYLLDETKAYSKPTIHSQQGKLKITVLPELEIDLDAVFKAPVFDF
ncbi:MAG: Uma2 family endonuclease [Desulfobacterales bacterium]|nr:Uma2 family endonuclease [Desulfobacterales bacterium]